MRAFLLLGGLLGFFLGWNLPNHYPLWTTFHGEVAAAVGACLVFLGALWPLERAGGLHGSTRLAIPWPARAWLLVACIPVAQYAGGLLDYRGDAVLGFLSAAGAGLSLYAGWLWSAQEGRRKVLKAVFTTILLSGIAAAGIALAQWCHLPTPGWWAMDLINKRPYGNFGQPNLFGLLMAMSMVSATALFEGRVLSQRSSYYLCMLFLGWCLLISESRASLLAMACVVVVWFATRGRAPTRLRISEMLVGLGVGFLIYRSLGAIQEVLYLASSAPRELAEVGPRRLIWLHYWAAILEHPWFGYGFEQGVAATREVAASVQPSRNATYAHNFVLDLMAWAGIPLASAMTLGFFGWVLTWLRKDEDKELAAQRHGVFAIWLALIVQSLLEFPYAHMFFLLPPALLAGAVTSQPTAIGKSPNASASWPARALAGAAMLLLVALIVDYVALEDGFRANRYERSAFVGRPVLQPVPEPYVLDQLAALNRSGRYAIRSGMPPEELSSLGKVARRFHLLPTRFDYAKALALNGRLADAEFELKTIRSTYPDDAYMQIERDWRNWLSENAVVIAAGRR